MRISVHRGASHAAARQHHLRVAGRSFWAASRQEQPIRWGSDSFVEISALRQIWQCRAAAAATTLAHPINLAGAARWRRRCWGCPACCCSLPRQEPHTQRLERPPPAAVRGCRARQQHPWRSLLRPRALGAGREAAARRAAACWVSCGGAAKMTGARALPGWGVLLGCFVSDGQVDVSTCMFAAQHPPASSCQLPRPPCAMQRQAAQFMPAGHFSGPHTALSHPPARCLDAEGRVQRDPSEASEVDGGSDSEDDSGAPFALRLYCYQLSCSQQQGGCACKPCGHCTRNGLALPQHEEGQKHRVRASLLLSLSAQNFWFSLPQIPGAAHASSAPLQAPRATAAAAAAAAAMRRGSSGGRLPGAGRSPRLGGGLRSS